MVPLFSRRSIMILVLGLIVGSLLGLGYWHILPVDANVQAGWPPLRVAGITNSRPAVYRSAVVIHVAGVGTTYTDAKELQRLGEYYASKLGSYRFLVFLGERLKEQAPELFQVLEERADELTVTDELLEMVTTKYWYDADATAEVRVDSRDASEAVLITGIIRQTFPTYLLAEDRDKWWREYEQTLAEFNKVNAELAKATEELNDIQLSVGTLDRDSAYVLAEAKARALSDQLDALTGELAFFIAEGPEGSGYGDTLAALDRVNAALAQARNEMTALEAGLDYSTAEAKVAALSRQLDALTDELAFFIAEGPEGSGYEDTLAALDRVSAALAQARNEMTALEAKAGVEGLLAGLDYTAAKAKVAALDGQISILARRLASLATEEPEQLEALGLFTIGEPINPVSVPRDRMRGRNALMMGAILGLGGAWVGLNYKGLASGLGLSREDTAEPEEDEEA